MKKTATIFCILCYLFGSTCFAELKTFDVALNWSDENSANVSGYNLYCGTSHGGPYTGVDITGGNPLDIPMNVITSTDDMSYTFAVTLDTDTSKNVFCIIKSYDVNGVEISTSPEIPFSPTIISTDVNNISVTINDIKNKNNNNNYIESVILSDKYNFSEEIIIKSGYFNAFRKEFVVIGKVTHNVWVISRDESGNSFQEKQIWLSGTAVDMINVDDIIPLNFNKGDETGSNRKKYDLAIVDYGDSQRRGQVKIFLNTGNAFSPTPISDSGYGDFTGGAFAKGTAGDYTGNGYDDLALYAPSTRNVVVWESNGTTFTGRGVWCQGGSENATIISVDYNGDTYDDIIFFNFIGGAFAAFSSNGSDAFVRIEPVRTFTPNAFDYALSGDFVIFNGKKREFAMHAKNTTGNFVVFKYAPDYSGDPNPFKSEGIWLNSSSRLY